MIKNIIKKRKAKLSKRGLYLQDRELMQTNFKVGQSFKYIVDVNKRTIKVIPTDESTNNTVSKRSLSDGLVKPVIDIRDREALQVFEGAEQLEVVILENQVIVRGILQSNIQNNVVFQYSDFAKNEVVINKAELAVGDSLFSFSSTDSRSHHYLQDNPQILHELPIVLRAMCSFLIKIDYLY